ncbi:recombination protein NinB [Variovorax sp. H27-G14]|uniref:recombination protein NinB n=1 Tax=Variovorax sp. H27-G14 TaxID=3111914 RepID=UPI0038FD1C75
MSETLTIELHNRQQAWAAIKAQVFPFLAQVLQGGHRWILTIGPRKRTKPQNRRYWGNGVLAQVAAQAAVSGRLYSAESWHEQFKRMFIGVEQLPDGSVIGNSSTSLSTVEFSEFCTQVEAYACAELGVTFYELEPA